MFLYTYAIMGWKEAALRTVLTQAGIKREEFSDAYRDTG